MGAVEERLAKGKRERSAKEKRERRRSTKSERQRAGKALGQRKKEKVKRETNIGRGSFTFLVAQLAKSTETDSCQIF